MAARQAGCSCFEGGIDVPRERISAVVPRNAEVKITRSPTSRTMSESAFDGWALEGAANGPTTAASVVASAVPGATISGMPPSSTTYPQPSDPIPDRRFPSSFRTHASGHHAWLPPPPAPSLIWTGAGRRDMGRVQ